LLETTYRTEACFHAYLHTVLHGFRSVHLKLVARTCISRPTAGPALPPFGMTTELLIGRLPRNHIQIGNVVTVTHLHFLCPLERSCSRWPYGISCFRGLGFQTTSPSFPSLPSISFSLSSDTRSSRRYSTQLRVYLSITFFWNREYVHYIKSKLKLKE
jgi:hypothetical protein